MLNMASFAIGYYVFFGAGGTSPDFYAYHTVAHTWTKTASLPENPSAQFSRTAFAIGQRAFLIDGNKIWIYDFMSDSWSLHNETMPGLDSRSSLVFFPHGDYVLLGGGQRLDAASSTLVFLYDFYRWYPPQK